MAEKLKSGAVVAPTNLKNLTFVNAEIANFNALSSKSNAKQIIGLLNRLYTQMDEAVSHYNDIFKNDTTSKDFLIFHVF